MDNTRVGVVLDTETFQLDNSSVLPSLSPSSVSLLPLSSASFPPYSSSQVVMQRQRESA